MRELNTHSVKGVGFVRAAQGVRLACLLGSLLLLVSSTGCGFLAGKVWEELPTEQQAFLGEDGLIADSGFGSSGFSLRSARASIGPVPQQLITLPKPVILLTPEVQREIRRFKRGDGRYTRIALERAEPHWSMMRQVFQQEGVPLELIGLAFVESGFRPDARSPAGAVGMWQFMPTTGRAYGLKVDMFTDHRKDPKRSTVAAAKHLRDLFLTFGDWNLALAAYNAGSGGMSQAINRGGTRDFWELARGGFLRRETQDFVPRVIAAVLVIEELEKEMGLDRN